MFQLWRQLMAAVKRKKPKMKVETLEAPKTRVEVTETTETAAPVAPVRNDVPTVPFGRVEVDGEHAYLIGNVAIPAMSGLYTIQRWYAGPFIPITAENASRSMAHTRLIFPDAVTCETFVKTHFAHFFPGGA